jgi:hypothetical protein
MTKRQNRFAQYIFSIEESPEEVITDNGREFNNGQFKKLCVQRKIKYTTVGVESHRSNGRVERVIRTVREAILKRGCKTQEEELLKIEDLYNNTYHSAIKCTPSEAWNDITGLARLENGPEGKYQKQFKRRWREQFKVRQQVKMAQRENLGTHQKDTKGRFVKSGVVVGKCGGDSYLVKDENGKLSKRRHFGLM